MKPKPLLALNHLTVPCSLLTSVFSSRRFGCAEPALVKLSGALRPNPDVYRQAISRETPARLSCESLRPNPDVYRQAISRETPARLSCVLWFRRAGTKKAASLTPRPLHNKGDTRATNANTAYRTKLLTCKKNLRNCCCAPNPRR